MWGVLPSSGELRTVGDETGWRVLGVGRGGFCDLRAVIGRGVLVQSGFGGRPRLRRGGFGPRELPAAELIEHLREDRELSSDLEAAVALVRSGAIVDAAEGAAGELS